MKNRRYNKLMARGSGESNQSSLGLRLPTSSQVHIILANEDLLHIAKRYQVINPDHLTEQEHRWLDNFWKEYKQTINRPIGSYTRLSDLSPEDQISRKYTVFDFETTGLDEREDRILQVALLQVDAQGKEINRFSSLINPEVEISEKNSAIHGITNEMVESSPTFAELWPKMKPFFEDSVLVAHNVRFDKKFLEAEAYRLGEEVLQALPKKYGCTLTSERLFHTGRLSYSLGDLLQARGITVDQARLHDALYDTEMAVLLLHDLISEDIDIAQVELDSDSYYANKSIRLHDPAPGYNYSALYKKAMKAGMRQAEDEHKADTERLTHFIEVLLNRQGKNGMTKEEMNIAFAALNLIIDKRKEKTES